MKSLVPWMCIVAVSASQQVIADNEFHAYRIGNYQNAAEPLRAKTGKDLYADYYLGRLYLYGYGYLKNNSLAMRYFTKSAEKGFLPAVQLMAKFSVLQEKNLDQAIRWFKQAASVGDVNAQMFMAAAYLYGLGVKNNIDTATKYYIEAAKNGNPIAQYTLAENFLDSRHSTNNKLGLIWLNRSAASGNAKALTKLGGLYSSGKLVTKDTQKGLELLNKAAAQNFAPALLALGDLALNNGEYQQALQWYNKAANQQDAEAYLHLAHAYLQEKSPIYDAATGYLWTLKAAQDGLIAAKSDLANLYQKGIGVEANADLAKQWLNQATQDGKTKNQTPALAKAALWLSDGASDQLEHTSYQMNGIFSAWQNPMALRENSYNQPPRLDVLTRQSLFKPQFELTQPNEVPINKYYEALVSKTVEFQANQWTYPSYSLNKYIQEIDKVNSMVLSRQDLPVPYLDANYYDYDDDYSKASFWDEWTLGWQKQVNYMSVFNQLYFKALLGDAQSQFEIGQMFQYGIGVEQNDASAIIFYQNAAEQQHLGAEYNLGLMHLQHPKDKNDYQVALNWLTDAAFKGNRQSQYVLAKILAQGVNGEEGKQYIKANQEEAMSMLYLAAANNYGPAEYELAEHLAREYENGLTIDVKKHKLALIRQLYQGAARNGVIQSLLPLAFYNAMDEDKQRQVEAFTIADNLAQTGDEKAALLLGMLYDRGIGVSADLAKAMYWYQKSGKNPVSHFILGTYTSEGKGVVADNEKGIDQLNQAAEAQFSYAYFNLAVLKQQAAKDFLPDLSTAYRLGDSHAGIVLADYYLAENNDKDKINQAKQIYVGLAEKGDQLAQLKLAYMMEKGLGAQPDVTAVQRWYTASAEQGDPVAEYLLAQFYQLGEIGEPDYKLAKEWYQKASRKLSKASVALGFIAETVDDDYPQAVKYYKQAAEQGDVLGVYNLALMNLYGKGMPVDYSKAKDLFTDAANKGISEAMTQLAGIYFNGLGLPRDEQQAYFWYKKAAALGNSNALYQLGLLSETGVVIKLDFADAVQFYQAASDKGNEKAMLALARIYYYGSGVGRDINKSVAFYQKLADRQNAYAQYKLGTFYLDGTVGAMDHSSNRGKQLLEQASENGSQEARKVLQKLDAQTQLRVSFIEPVLINNAAFFEGQTANLMYLEALNEWNRGDEVKSRMILHRVVTQFPQFVPAKRVYEQIRPV